jgi:hypothetical protein
MIHDPANSDGGDDTDYSEQSAMKVAFYHHYSQMPRHNPELGITTLIPSSE